MQPTKYVNVNVLRAECRACSNQFETIEIPDFVYGERLLRTVDGKDIAFVHCLEDPVFSEVAEMIDELLQNFLSEHERAQKFDEVFGAACNPLDGKPIDAFKPPVCPKCGSEDIVRFDYDPPKTAKVSLPIVMHENWLRMGQFEKKQMLRSHIRRKGGGSII
jgi:hypothetical protein